MKSKIVLVLLVMSAMTGLASASAETYVVQIGLPVSIPGGQLPIEVAVVEDWNGYESVHASIAFPQIETPEAGTCEYPGHPPCTPPEVWISEPEPEVWTPEYWYWNQPEVWIAE